MGMRVIRGEDDKGGGRGWGVGRYVSLFARDSPRNNTSVMAKM